MGVEQVFHKRKWICKSIIKYLAVMLGIGIFLHLAHSHRNILKCDHITTTLDISYVEKNFNGLDQHDKGLIEYTRIRFMSPPPESNKPYKLKDKKKALTKTEITAWVVEFFGNKRSGTFIETGANDGELASNTLYLEKELGWSGLLIECNPYLVPEIIRTHRKVWVGGVCISTSSSAGTFNFEFKLGHTSIGIISDRRKPMDKNYAANPPNTFFEVQGVPLYTILASIGLTEVDFFSFDIEAQELAVLREFPFEKVIFKVICVEIGLYNEEEKVELNTLLTKNNYTFVTNLRKWDNVYVHKSVVHMIPNVK